ncbi:MAG TPA: DUF4097 family beta strand repeat-containing protein [Steroidobacteraceae bacterium]|nr:DUF4097 family beta strand repeat-containing protein [Steroidobacteraceae bacterium]
MSHQWMILAIAPCIMVAASPADAATSFSKLVPADAKGRVQVSNVSGDITITAWDRREVDVQGEYGTGIERIDVAQNGGDVQVKVIYKDRGWLDRNGWRDSDVQLQVKVPVEAELEASTVSGTIVVNGARGEQRLKSVSGDVRSDVVGTEVNATTISGLVDLTGTGKEVHVRASSVSGDVRLRRMGGDIEVRSTSGDVDVEVNAATDVHGSVVSGSLSMRGTLAPEAEVDVSAVSGRLRLTAQAPAGFRYDVTTFSGNVRNCFGAEPEADGYRRNWNPGTRLIGKRGEGRASIRARSHSGSVELCDR